MQPTVRSEPGDIEVRLQAIAGVYRGTRRGHTETHWFAHRRPHDRVLLDLERRNGVLYLDTGPDVVGHLLVDGAVAVEAGQQHPGPRRLFAMVEEGFPTWSEPPHQVEPVEWDGRPAERLRWEVDGRWVEATYDAATSLCVASSTPEEVDELTGLTFDDDVDPGVFTAPVERIDGWRGGVAYVVEDPRRAGHYTSQWEPSSGPGSLLVRGPSGALEEGLAWARERTGDVWTRETGGEHRRP